MNSKNKIVYWVLTCLVSLIFIGSGIQKFVLPADAEMVAISGGQTNALILGIMQLVFAVLFIIPRTALIGSLFLIAYMGGAIAVHFVDNDNIIAPVVIQTLIWITTFYRFPELKKRICGCENTSCQK